MFNNQELALLELLCEKAQETTQWEKREQIAQLNKDSLEKALSEYFASEHPLSERLKQEIEMNQVIVSGAQECLDTDVNGHEVHSTSITAGKLEIHIDFKLMFDNGWVTHSEEVAVNMNDADPHDLMEVAEYIDAEDIACMAQHTLCNTPQKSLSAQQIRKIKELINT
ncbi:hypothetical protein ACP3V3_19765 [Vibrio sp. PNB22_3_1]